MRRKYLREIDRDIAEEEALETERITKAYEKWLERGQPLSELNDDGWDEADPYNRLKQEGGYLGE